MAKKQNLSEVEEAENVFIQAAGQLAIRWLSELTAAALENDETETIRIKLREVVQAIHDSKQRKVF